MKLPNNLAFAIATVFATGLSVTAATNATETVFTVTNTYATGDLFEYIGGWSAANGRVFRAKAVTGTSVTVEGLDTSDTSLFPAGAGIGTIRKITTWVPITGVLSVDVSGGDPKNVEVPLLDSNMPISLPDGFGAITLTMSIGDDKTLPHHAALKAISDGVKLTCLRAIMPGGDMLLYAGYCGFNESPSLSKGSAMAVKATFALQNKPVRY